MQNKTAKNVKPAATNIFFACWNRSSISGDSPTFGMQNRTFILAFFLASIVAFYFVSIRTFYLAFFCGILSHIYSVIRFGILSGTLPGIVPDIFSDILSVFFLAFDLTFILTLAFFLTFCLASLAFECWHSISAVVWPWPAPEAREAATGLEKNAGPNKLARKGGGEHMLKFKDPHLAGGERYVPELATSYQWCRQAAHDADIPSPKSTCHFDVYSFCAQEKGSSYVGGYWQGQLNEHHGNCKRPGHLYMWSCVHQHTP